MLRPEHALLRFKCPLCSVNSALILPYLSKPAAEIAQASQRVRVLQRKHALLRCQRLLCGVNSLLMLPDLSKPSAEVAQTT